MNTDKNVTRSAKILFLLITCPSLISVISGITGYDLYANLTTYILSIPLLLSLFIKNKTAKFSRCALFPISFILIFLISYSYTISKYAAQQKFIAVIYLCLIPCILVLLTLRKSGNINDTINEFLKYNLKYSCPIIIVLAILFILGFREAIDDNNRLMVMGFGHPIWASRYVAYLLIFPICFLFKNGSLSKWGWVAIPCAMLLLVSSGSRGPLISFIISVYIIICPKISLKKNILLIIILCAVAYLFMTFSGRMQTDAADSSNAQRILLITRLFENDFDILKGVGIGSYQLLVTGIDEVYYPHNIILETFVEAGLIGLVTLSVFFLYLFRRFRLNLICTICLYYLLNAQLSGDISGNNNFFILATICMAILPLRKSDKSIFSDTYYLNVHNSHNFIV